MGYCMASNIDRLTFWRSWWDGIRHYPDDQRLAIYDAILSFAFESAEPRLPDGDLTSAIVYQTVSTIRPTIEISRKRREFGERGGSKRKANAKQSASKRQAKRKQEQVQEQVQEQDQDQDHNGNRVKGTTATKGEPPTLAQFISGGDLAGVPADFARRLHKDLTEAGWRDAAGLYVANWRRYLKSAWGAEQKKISAARVDGIGGFRIAR